MISKCIPEMVFIPGGSFMMGVSTNERGESESEKPQHKVTVPAFYMGRYPVTQAQYKFIMGENPSHFSHQGDNKPVERVSWNQATAFCQRLSEVTSKKYRLPSEAEWEYACRGGTTTPFHFGETITSDLANYDGSVIYGEEPRSTYRKETTEVGSFPPNGWGLYDMHGNVWEWCDDEWHGNYQGAPINGSPWLEDDDRGRRVLRGGSWDYGPRLCRSAFRYFVYADQSWDDTGFRVACDYKLPFQAFGF
jgi:formylglycine-generating enzyme required for sulfatase activity